MKKFILVALGAIILSTSFSSTADAGPLRRIFGRSHTNRGYFVPTGEIDDLGNREYYFVPTGERRSHIPTYYRYGEGGRAWKVRMSEPYWYY